MDIYKSNRLTYRPIGDVKHEEFLFSLLTEPGVLNFDTSIPAGVSRADMAGVGQSMRARKLLSMYICLPPTPTLTSASASASASSADGDGEATPIGVVSLSRPEDRQGQHGRSFLSVAVGRRWQRRGYGREAVAWALDWAFDFARLHRVEASCYAWNPGARRLYARLGFRPEGVRREAVWFMGAWHDLHELAVLEHEWRGPGRAAAGAGTWAPVAAAEGDGGGVVVGRSYSSAEIAEKMGSA
ncbi:putative gnat family [Rosellinia necatrix]|uniref:Putative gnat family n=1 Tax=Rosellinia necatrix TaxID=77044 RepID=A0A1S8AB51_ROSNE|nr:putative gnat family [Rosellinia necatrix]